MNVPDIIAELPRLRLPAPHDLRVRTARGGDQIFDPIRAKWVALTPEEWVRQHAIELVVARLGVGPGLLAVERELVWEGTRRRADLVAYDRKGRPWLVVECKAPSVRVSQVVLDQAGRYNGSAGAQYVIVTNGLELVGWEAMPDGGYRIMQELPEFAHS